MKGQSYPVSVLNVNNGLLSGTVECGVYDSRGLVWIGTREGLHRYDGKSVVRYLPDVTDPGTIRSKSIYSLAEDHYGHIWMIGDLGVEVFIPEENCFEQLASNPYDALNSFRLIDSLNLGIVYGYDGKNHSMVISLEERMYIPKYKDLTLQQQKILSTSWINRTTVQQYLPSQTSTSFNFRKYLSDRKDEAIRIRSDAGGLWCYSLKKGGFTKFTNGDSLAQWIPVHHAWPEIEKNGLMSMMEYNDSLAIAGLYGFGLILFHKSSGEVVKSWDLRSDPLLGKITDYLFLMKDPSGRVWFSIMPYGVFVFDPLSPRFQLLRNNTENSLLHNGLLRSLICDTAGRLWIGYHDGFVQVMDPHVEKEVFHFALPADRIRVKPQVESIDLLPDASLFVTGRYVIIEIEHRMQVQKLPFSDSVFFPNFIHTCYRSDFIPVYSNTPPGKLTIISKTDSREIALPRSVDYPLKLYYVKDQIAFYTGPPNYFGMLSFDRMDSSQILDKKYFNFKILGVHRNQASDSLWMATDKGLGLYNIKTRSFHMEDTRSWPSNYLYGILPDKEGNLWISSNAGLIRYHPVTKATRFIGVPEGMQSNEFNTNCYAKMKDGSLAFAGPEGLNVFHPSYFDEPAEPFYVYMTGVSVKEKPLKNFNSFSPSFEWTLSPDEKSIEIKYSSTKYFQRTGLQYFVRLSGADPDWVDRGQLESVRYINLKPDKYTLHIKAKDGQSNWSKNEMTATILVRPTFFQTIWFVMLCGFVVTGILYTLYQYRIRQLKNVLLIRNRISRDLHDDIGSTLGSISIYSEVAKTSYGENRTDVLDKIGDASREMLEKLNDIVWSINPENDTLEKMEKRMRSYAAMMLNPLGIQFDLQLKTNNQSARLDMDHRRNLFLIFKEALHNAAKYAHCKHVHILLEELHGRIQMEIRDDGLGFDQTKLKTHNGNGLDSMKERAHHIGAELKIDSKPGSGTHILLQQK